MTTTPDPSSPLASRVDAARPAKLRVLLLGAHTFVRQGIRAVLRTAPELDICAEGDVHNYPIGRIALALPDVLVIDASTDDAMSHATIHAVRQLSADIGIVALAADDRATERQRLFTAGASEVVSILEVADRVADAVRRAGQQVGRQFALEAVRAQLADATRNAIAPDDGLALDALDREIIAGIGTGLASSAIALRLRLPLRTVETRVSRLRAKLNLASAVHVVEFCVEYCRRQER